MTDDSLLGGLDDLSIAYERPVVAETVSPQEFDLLIARLTSPSEAGLEIGGPQTEETLTSDVRDLANLSMACWSLGAPRPAAWTGP